MGSHCETLTAASKSRSRISDLVGLDVLVTILGADVEAAVRHVIRELAGGISVRMWMRTLPCPIGLRYR